MSYQANPCTQCVMPGLYRCLKRRLGCSLKRFHSKQHLVSSRKSITHTKLSGIKGCLTGPKKVPKLCRESSCSNRHRQHHSCGIDQQGGRYEVRLTLCPSLAPPVLMQSETYCPGCLNVITDMLSRQGQITQTEWSHHQGVFDMFATRYNCKLTKYVSPVPTQTLGHLML